MEQPIWNARYMGGLGGGGNGRQSDVYSGSGDIDHLACAACEQRPIPPAGQRPWYYKPQSFAPKYRTQRGSPCEDCYSCNGKRETWHDWFQRETCPACAAQREPYLDVNSDRALPGRLRSWREPIYRDDLCHDCSDRYGKRDQWPEWLIYLVKGDPRQEPAPGDPYDDDKVHYRGTQGERYYARRLAATAKDLNAQGEGGKACDGFEDFLQNPYKADWTKESPRGLKTRDYSELASKWGDLLPWSPYEDKDTNERYRKAQGFKNRWGRKRTRKPKEGSPPDIADTLGRDVTTEALIDRTATRQELRPMWDALTMSEQRALWLTEIDDLTQEQAGREMGVSQQMVNKYLKAARTKGKAIQTL